VNWKDHYPTQVSTEEGAVELNDVFELSGVVYARSAHRFWGFDGWDWQPEGRDPRVWMVISETFGHDGQIFLDEGGEVFRYAPEITEGWKRASDPRHAETSADTGPDQLSASSFFDGKTFVPRRLGVEIQRRGHIRVGPGGGLYRYKNGVYRPKADAWVAQQAQHLLGERFRNNHVKESTAWLRAQEPTVSADPSPDTVDCRNGLLDWRTGALRPHDPDEVFVQQIPVEWHPDAECPVVLNFLEETLGSDMVDVAFESIGYTLLPRNPFKKAFMLVGPRNSGKGTLLDLLVSFLGRENCSFSTLHALSDNNFRGAELVGKMANICGDLDARALEKSDTFKMLTGNDHMTVEQKYKDPFDFVNHAKLFFGANEVPGSADQGDAYWKRWLFLPCPHSVPEGSQDLGLGAHMAAPEELSGVFRYAVEGLRRLTSRGAFELPESATSVGKELINELDSLRRFVREACELGPAKAVLTTELLAAYKSWASEAGVPLLSRNAFYESLRAKFSDSVEKVKNSKGNFEFRGIGLQG
jgi:putative DNA primase/helicase